MRRTVVLAASMLLGVTSRAEAHDVFPESLELCRVAPHDFATFELRDPTGCTAIVTARTADAAIATVEPPGPFSVVRQIFTVRAVAAGETSILVTFMGDRAGCTENGSHPVPVIVRDASAPECRGLLFKISDQIIDSTRQRVAVIRGTFVPPDACGCSRVVIAQTIEEEGRPPRIDVDSSVTRVATPFYNYDPATGMRVPNPMLGAPGDCSGAANATLWDTPQRAPGSGAAMWQTCAVCCDDGSILGCHGWSYDPNVPRGTVIDGMPVNGLYFDDGALDGFTDPHRDAYRAGLEDYLRTHPAAAADPCTANLTRAFGGTVPPPAAGAGGSSSGGCRTAAGPQVPARSCAIAAAIIALALGRRRAVSRR